MLRDRFGAVPRTISSTPQAAPEIRSLLPKRATFPAVQPTSSRGPTHPRIARGLTANSGKPRRSFKGWKRLPFYNLAALWSGCDLPIPPDATSVEFEFVHPSRGFPHVPLFVWRADTLDALIHESTSLGPSTPSPSSAVAIFDSWLRSMTETTTLRITPNKGGTYTVDLGGPYTMSNEPAVRIAWASRVDPNDRRLRTWMEQVDQVWDVDHGQDQARGLRPDAGDGRDSDGLPSPLLDPESDAASVRPASLLEICGPSAKEETVRGISSVLSASRAMILPLQAQYVTLPHDPAMPDSREEVIEDPDASRARPPWAVISAFEEARHLANRQEIAILLASALESLGEAPLLVHTRYGMVAGWMLRRRPSYRPLWNPGDVARAVGEDSLVLLDPWTPSGIGSARAEDVEYAVDVRATRPEVGKIAPLRLTREPPVNQAIVWANALGRSKGRLETKDLLLGVLRSDGGLLRDALVDAGVHVGWLSGPAVDPPADMSPLAERTGTALPMTRSYAVCLELATTLSREAGASSVRERDLVWALVQSRSRTTWEFLENWGLGIDRVQRALAKLVPPPAHTHWE